MNQNSTRTRIQEPLYLKHVPRSKTCVFLHVEISKDGFVNHSIRYGRPFSNITTSGRYFLTQRGDLIKIAVADNFKPKLGEMQSIVGLCFAGRQIAREVVVIDEVAIE